MENEKPPRADTPPATAAIAQTREQSQPTEEGLPSVGLVGQEGRDFEIGTVLIRSVQELPQNDSLETHSIVRSESSALIRPSNDWRVPKQRFACRMSCLSLDP